MAWAVAFDDVAPVAERVGTAVSTIVRPGLSARLTGRLEAMAAPCPPFSSPETRESRNPGGSGGAGGIEWTDAAGQSSPRSILCCGASDSLLHRTRRGATRLGSARQWPGARKGRELAHPSRVRLGQFRMASLARGTRRAAHARSLRRAWMRSLRPRGAGAVPRTLGGRPRNRYRRGWLGPVRPLRDLPGRGHRRRVQRLGIRIASTGWSSMAATREDGAAAESSNASVWTP